MPIVRKALKIPAYVDARIPEAELRRESMLTGKHQPAVAGAFTRMTNSLIDDATKKRLILKIREVVDGEATIEEALDEVQWYDPNKPESLALWTMLSNSLERALSATIEDAGNGELKFLKIPLKIKVEKKTHVVASPESVRFVEARIGFLVAGISDQQRELFRSIILDRLEKGVSPTEVVAEMAAVAGLTQREWIAVEARSALITGEALGKTGTAPIRRYIKELLVARGKRIARTETVGAYSQGIQGAWKAAQNQGYIEQTAMKEWLEIAASKRTCKICLALGGQVVPISENFYSEFVGEVDVPPSHNNCRCTVTLVIPSNPKEALASSNAETNETRATLAEG